MGLSGYAYGVMASLTIPDPENAPPQARVAAQALLQWWQAMGVDQCVGDEAENHLLIKKPVSKPHPQLAAVAPTQPQSPKPKADTDLTEATAKADTLAATAKDFDGLVEAIEAFDLCPLRTPATNTVVYRGNPKAKLMIIGEAPGFEENKRKQPFVGTSGQLLDQMLAAIGLGEDDVLITNVVYWRPPSNRKPSPAEMAMCKPFVDQAIRLMAPKLIVLAGGAAATGVLGTDQGILSLRGRWQAWQDPRAGAADGSNLNAPIPVLPTLHPAFLLRQPLAKKKAWIDMLSLAERLEG
mgnify:CR=1 FL=1